MKPKTFIAFSTGIFTVVAIGHLTRVIYTWDLTIDTTEIPIWVSAVVVLITGIMLTNGLQLLEGKKKK